MIPVLYNVAVPKDGDVFIIRRGVKPTLWSDMAASEDGRHVYIVRIWFEPREIAGAAPLMRGTIEHLPSGARHGVTSLQQIPAFMRATLLEAGELMPRDEHTGDGEQLTHTRRAWRRWGRSRED